MTTDTEATYSNGQLPDSALASLAGNPGKRLRKDAAAAFNAMYHQHPVHVSDAYRPLGHPGDLAKGIWSQWAAWERYQQGGSLAAYPGTSNHGWGMAIDCASSVDRVWIDRIGAHYGWSKTWSDAPTEWWHILYKVGVWTPPTPSSSSYTGSGHVYFALKDGEVDFDKGTWQGTVHGRIAPPNSPHPSYHGSGKAYFEIPDGSFDLDHGTWGGTVHGRKAP